MAARIFPECGGSTHSSAPGWPSLLLGAVVLRWLILDAGKRLSGTENFTQCPWYLLQEGLTSGCLLQEELGDVMLYLRLVNGTDVLLTRNMYISDYLKPASPGRLQFRWLGDTLRVTCAGLNYSDLLYEIQHKTLFDPEWQSQAEDTCNVTLLGVDASKCYSFRARVRPLEHSYGPDALPSDWSPEVHQQGRTPAESCPRGRPSRTLPKFVLVCGLVLVLTLLLTALSVWKLQRVKRLLLPSVPDPSASFPGLFEAHQGDFQCSLQAWIQRTQNVDTALPDGVLEETLVEPWASEEPRSLAVTTAPSLEPVAPQRTPGPAPGQGQRVQLQELTFVVQEDAYVTF
ncbi:cytokine receptor-like factor 2 [Sorex araneus]|uniref:cytokine receptor-like factor 2 n=1 Tax=Sorex araneus TaxID=42254 RepID=UPI00243383FF|nr:cytokine receptor-like factor 2 [Sorex araneus]